MKLKSLISIICFFTIFSCSKKDENKVEKIKVGIDKKYIVKSKMDDLGNFMSYQYINNQLITIKYKSPNKDTITLYQFDYKDNSVLFKYFSNVNSNIESFYEGNKYPKYSRNWLDDKSFLGGTFYEYDNEDYLKKIVFSDSINKTQSFNFFSFLNGNMATMINFSKNNQGATIDSFYCEFDYYDNKNSLGFIGNPIFSPNMYIFKSSNSLLKSISINGVLGYNFEYIFDENSNPISRVNTLNLSKDQFSFEEY